MFLIDTVFVYSRAPNPQIICFKESITHSSANRISSMAWITDSVLEQSTHNVEIKEWNDVKRQQPLHADQTYFRCIVGGL